MIYRRKSELAEAVRWHPGMATVWNVKIAKNPSGAHVATIGDRRVEIRDGDYVLKFEKGGIGMCRSEEFQSRYEPAVGGMK